MGTGDVSIKLQWLCCWLFAAWSSVLHTCSIQLGSGGLTCNVFSHLKFGAGHSCYLNHLLWLLQWWVSSDLLWAHWVGDALDIAFVQLVWAAVIQVHVIVETVTIQLDQQCHDESVVVLSSSWRPIWWVSFDSVETSLFLDVSTWTYLFIRGIDLEIIVITFDMHQQLISVWQPSVNRLRLHWNIGSCI